MAMILALFCVLLLESTHVKKDAWEKLKWKSSRIMELTLKCGLLPDKIVVQNHGIKGLMKLLQ